ncbi:hypothetical protein [Lactobacillus sp. Sy-1]|uniref:hypothetical protein n=1 Tax=Lactobacillus sp. Sy-1 TaxID=2109645 RepID=UPI001C5AA4E5|nr:hypothetical protein [Lactobacillus sp. Sy-1]MBW1606458.1 hypothetical protein [Lactobacillus sp. Sy-1]
MEQKSIADYDTKSQDILQKLKELYKDQIKYIGANPEENVFIWTKEYLKVWIIQIYNRKFPDTPKFFFFATSGNFTKDEIILKDLRESTNIYSIQRNIFDVKKTIQSLIANNLLPKNLNIVESSIYNMTNSIKMGGFLSDESLNFPAENFADNEAKAIDNNLSKSSNDFFNLDKRIFFAKKYDFDNIIKVVDNKHFEARLDDCLWAYNKEKWFLAASGLGSVMEELLILSVMNFSNANKKMIKSLGHTPTLSNYLAALRQKPVEMDMTQERYIRCIFELRNCTNHYSSGFTTKSITDELLLGLRNLYDEFYVKSLEYVK